MAKRKNPLQDIDAFLSQEASNLVTPNPVSSNKEPETKDHQTDTKVDKGDIQQQLLEWANEYGDDFRSPFYELMIKTIENLSAQKSKDKMLINTLLYLQNPDAWKESVKDYWS